MKLGRRKDLPQRAIDFSGHVHVLYGYALILSRNRTDAEDLVQETCLRAVRAMERLLPDSNVVHHLEEYLAQRSAAVASGT